MRVITGEPIPRGAIMTKTETQTEEGSLSRQAHGASAACAEVVDVCELLVAELQARRARLKHLLRLVHTELERNPARRSRVCVRTRPATGFSPRA